VIPKLHIVTDDEILGRRDFLATAKKVLDAGRHGVALHLRGSRTKGRELFSLASSLLPTARETGGRLLANDRVDLALALDMDGVHLGQRSLPADVARGLLGRERILGLSVHGPGEAAEWGEDTLDFLILGSIFHTSSHPERAPGGTGMVQEVAGATGLPVVAIGGITPARVGEVLSAGASGVAVRGGVWNSEDPTAAIGGYLREMDQGAPKRGTRV
jgi:thiamine-phosphate pyrophosphorylase